MRLAFGFGDSINQINHPSPSRWISPHLLRTPIEQKRWRKEKCNPHSGLFVCFKKDKKRKEKNFPVSIFLFIFGDTVPHRGSQFTDQGSNPHPWQWKCGVLAIGQTGKSLDPLFWPHSSSSAISSVYTIGSSSPQVVELRLNSTISFPGSPACRRQTEGLLSLHSSMSQFCIIILSCTKCSYVYMYVHIYIYSYDGYKYKY